MSLFFQDLYQKVFYKNNFFFITTKFIGGVFNN